METKELARIFKAVADNVSDDKFRAGLTHVFAKDARVLEATDGHALIRVTLSGDGHGLAPGYYEPKQAAALLKAGVVPQPVALDYQWPQTDQVIPSLESECALTSNGIGFSAALLSRILDSVARVTGADVRTRLVFTDHLSPARIDAEGNGIRVIAVVMPMSIYGVDEKPKPRPAPKAVETPAPVVETPVPVETPASSYTRGPRPGYTVTPKPCPVCGTPNAARRFSFLCESHRSPEYLAAHKRAA